MFGFYFQKKKLFFKNTIKQGVQTTGRQWCKPTSYKEKLN